MTDDQREWAIRRIRAKRDFKAHVVVYLAVNVLLVFIWAMSAATYFWPVWPILGWGIALAAHAVRVYGGSSGISDAQIDAELRDR